MATIFSIQFDVESLKRSADQSKKEVESLSRAFDDVQRSSKSSTDSASKSISNLSTIAQREFQKAQSQVDKYKNSLASLDAETKRLNNRMSMLSEAKTGGTVGFVEFKREQADMEKRLADLQKQRESVVSSLAQAEKGLLREERNLSREQDRLTAQLEKAGREEAKSIEQKRKMSSGFDAVEASSAKLFTRLVSGASVIATLTSAYKGLYDVGVSLPVSLERSNATFEQSLRVSGQLSSSVTKEVYALRELGLSTVEAQGTIAELARVNIDASRSSDIVRAAQNAAAITGKTLAETTDLLTSAIATGNKVGLRSIGVTVDYESALRQLARQTGQTVDELGANQVVAARLEATLKATTAQTGAAAAVNETLSGKIDLAAAAGRSFVETTASIIGVSSAAKGAVDNFTQGITNLESVFIGTAYALKDFSFSEILTLPFRSIREFSTEPLDKFIEKINQASERSSNYYEILRTEGPAAARAFAAANGQAGIEVGKLVDGLNKLNSTAESTSVDNLRIQIDTATESLNAGRLSIFQYIGAIASLAAAQGKAANAAKNKQDSERERLITYAENSPDFVKEARRKKLNKDKENASLLFSDDPKKLKQVVAALDSELAQLDKQTSRSSSGFKKAESAAKAFENTMARLTMTSQEYKKFQIEQEAAGYAKSGIGADKINEFKRLSLLEAERKAIDENTKLLSSFDTEYQRVFAGLKPLNKSLATSMDTYRVAAEEAFRSGSISADELAQKMREIDELQRYKLTESSTSFSDGLSRGFTKVIAEVNNYASVAENLITSSFRGMEDSFVKFAQTGKLEFSSLTNSIISDLTRMFSRMAITGPLSSLLGGLFGSVFGGGMSPGSMPNPMGSLTGGGIGNIFKFENGGVMSRGLSTYSNKIVDSPTFFNASHEIKAFARGGVMGEAGPEAIMPLRRDSNGNLGVNAEGLGSQTNVIIHNYSGEPVKQKQSQGPMGEINLELFIGRLVDARVTESLSNGRYANALEAGGVATYTRARR